MKVSSSLDVLASSFPRFWELPNKLRSLLPNMLRSERSLRGLRERSLTLLWWFWARMLLMWFFCTFPLLLLLLSLSIRRSGSGVDVLKKRVTTFYSPRIKCFVSRTECILIFQSLEIETYDKICPLKKCNFQKSKKLWRFWNTRICNKKNVRVFVKTLINF